MRGGSDGGGGGGGTGLKKWCAEKAYGASSSHGKSGSGGKLFSPNSGEGVDARREGSTTYEVEAKEVWRKSLNMKRFNSLLFFYFEVFANHVGTRTVYCMCDKITDNYR